MFGKVATQTTQTTHGRHHREHLKIVKKPSYSALLKLRCVSYVRENIILKIKVNFYSNSMRADQ